MNQRECIPSRSGFNRCCSGLRWANSKGSFEFDLPCVTFLRLTGVVGVEWPGEEDRFGGWLLLQDVQGVGHCGETATRGVVAPGSGAVPTVS